LPDQEYQDRSVILTHITEASGILLVLLACIIGHLVPIFSAVHRILISVMQWCHPDDWICIRHVRCFTRSLEKIHLCNHIFHGGVAEQQPRQRHRGNGLNPRSLNRPPALPILPVCLDTSKTYHAWEVVGADVQPQRSSSSPAQPLSQPALN
jgi:hypothetical protein